MRLLMHRKLGLASCVMAFAVVQLACTGTTASPTSPTAAGGTGGADVLGPGESNLKVTAPPPQSPVNEEIPGLRPDLVFGPSAGLFINPADLDYRVQVYDTDGNLVAEVFVTDGVTATPSADLEPGRGYRWRVRAELGSGIGPWSPDAAFQTAELPVLTAGPRTPDPAPGTRLPLPNMSHVVDHIAMTHASQLRRSCQEHGGTWEFMDAVVDFLRANHDTRWGYNWKRGRVGDASLDVIAYHSGAGPSEGSTQVYIIDIIGGHCGSSPRPSWNDVTQVTRDAGAIGRWTGRGRF